MEYADMLGLSFHAALCMAVVVSHLDNAHWDYVNRKALKEREAEEWRAQQKQVGDVKKPSRWGR